MMNPPVFFEALDDSACPRARVCRQTAMMLFRRGITPLPFASTDAEAKSIFESLWMRGMRPSIVVVNTFAAETHLDALDRIFGPVPFLFLNREAFADTPAFRRLFGAPRKTSTSIFMKGMTQRLAAAWTYGTANASEVADRAAFCVEEFAYGQSFSILESPHAYSAARAARVCAAS